MTTSIDIPVPGREEYICLKYPSVFLMIFVYYYDVVLLKHSVSLLLQDRLCKVMPLLIIKVHNIKKIYTLQ